MLFKGDPGIARLLVGATPVARELVSPGGSPAGWVRLKQAALRLAQPLAVHLELTYRCNWRCVFCYNPRHFDRARLSAAEWSRVLDDLRSLGTLTVTLTGGEPLAHPEFLEIAKAVRARALALKIFTNGSLVDEPMAEAVALLRPLSVEMSLHGATAEVHDRATRRPGSFTAMWAGLDRLRRRDVPVLLKSPLTRLNEHELDGMIALVRERGLPWRVDPTLTPRDDGDLSPLAYTPSPGAVQRMMARLADLGEVPSSRRTPGGTNCGLGRVTLAIDPEGVVFPCIQWRRTSLGSVRDVPLRRLWHESRERLDAAEVARRANDVLLERGGPLARFPFCPALALQKTGDPLEADEQVLQLAAAAEAARPVPPVGGRG